MAAAGKGLIPLWVGEGDLPTPDFISDAAVQVAPRRRDLLHLPARPAGTSRRARPLPRARLRQTVRCRALLRHRFGGMQAIQIAARMVSGVGDEVLVPTPAWPNFVSRRRRRRRHSGRRADDVRQRRLDARPRPACSTSATPKTKAIFLNSPSNPTGWTASLDELQRDPRRSPASAACGSSPTRSITASSTRARARRRSTTSPIRTTGSSSSTPSPRTGR